MPHTTVRLIFTRALGLLGGSFASEGQLPSTRFARQERWGSAGSVDAWGWSIFKSSTSARCPHHGLGVLIREGVL